MTRRRAALGHLPCPLLCALLCVGACQPGDPTSYETPPDGSLLINSALDATSGPPIAQPPIFTDVTTAAGLPTAASMCLVFSDLDGDGRPDLLISQPTADDLFSGHLDLYRNRGDGTFAPSYLMTALTAVSSCRAVDWNGDGIMDVVALGGVALERRIAFFQGQGNGNFEDVTAQVFTDSLALTEFVSAGTLGFADLDGDGFLDFIIGDYAWPQSQSGPCVVDCVVTAHDFQCYFTNPMPTRLTPLVYFNRAGKSGGTRSFVSSTNLGFNVGLRAENLANIGFIDWDGDGRIDILASHDFGKNALYHNQDGASFVDLLPTWQDDPYNHGMGTALADFDGDGLWDFHVADLGPDRLYFGLADGTGENRAEAWGLEAITRFHSGWSPIAEDFNADGWVDLFIANGAVQGNQDELNAISSSCGPVTMISSSRAQTDFLLVNDNGQRFSEIDLPHPDSLPSPSQAGSAIADFDGDGDVDLAVIIDTFKSTLRLLRNDTPLASTRTLSVRLEGKAPATDAIGAVVVAKSNGAEAGRRIVGGGGSLGDSSRDLHFGMGRVGAIDSLEITWPSGQRQTVMGPFTIGNLALIKQP